MKLHLKQIVKPTQAQAQRQFIMKYWLLANRANWANWQWGPSTKKKGLSITIIFWTFRSSPPPTLPLNNIDYILYFHFFAPKKAASIYKRLPNGYAEGILVHTHTHTLHAILRVYTRYTLLYMLMQYINTLNKCSLFPHFFPSVCKLFTVAYQMITKKKKKNRNVYRYSDHAQHVYVSCSTLYTYDVRVFIMYVMCMFRAPQGSVYVEYASYQECHFFNNSVKIVCRINVLYSLFIQGTMVTSIPVG